MRSDGAIDYPEHLTRNHPTAGEEKTQLNKNPLGFSVFEKQSQIESGVGIACYVDMVAACPIEEPPCSPFADSTGRSTVVS